MRYGIAIAVLALALSACGIARFGREFDVKAFESRVERGKTTQADVRGWLGAPVGIGVTVDPNGERYAEWTYYYGETRLPSGADAFLKVLQIKFDNRTGVVRAYNWSGESK